MNNITTIDNFINYVTNSTDEQLLGLVMNCNKIQINGKFDRGSFCYRVLYKIKSTYNKSDEYISNIMCNIVANELMNRIATFKFDPEMYANECKLRNIED